MSDISYRLISAVRSGRLHDVNKLINNFGLSYSRAWSGGYVLLLDAIKYKRTEVAKLLITNNAKVNGNIKRTDTPLHCAVRNDCIEIVEMLLDRNADIEAKDKIARTPLDIAVDGKKIEMIELLLNRGCNFSGTSCDGGVLLCAIEREHLQLVERLLNDGVYPNFAYKTSTYKEGCTPLCLSVKKRNEVIIKLLLSKGANINATGPGGVSPLHIAVENGHLPIVKLFLDSGAYIDCMYTSPPREGYTPLYLAVEKEYVEIVKLLLEKGANVNTQDKNGKTLLHLTVEREHSVILDLIFKYYPDIVHKEGNRDALNVAVLGYKSKKYSKIVENMLQHGFTLNREDVNNCKLLHAAVRKGYFKIVQQFLQYGADVNMLYTSSFRNGCMPLHVAARNQQEEIAKLLISYAADVNAKDEMGKTPIFRAIENADFKITKLLLSNGANIKGSPELLNIAVQKECKEIVKVLLQHGADINATDEDGRTALHFHTVEKCKGLFPLARIDSDRNIEVIIKILLSRGANVNAQQKDGWTALHIATDKGYTEVVEVLLRCGANVNLKIKPEGTPLHMAVYKRYLDIVKVLIKFGADIDSTNNSGNTALHISCYKGYPEIVTALINHGSDINNLSRNIWSPLVYATKRIFSYGIYNDPIIFKAERKNRGPSYSQICWDLEEHIVKMQTANLCVTFKLNSDTDFFKHWNNKCEEEIARLKSEKISNSNVSFYDILTKGINRLAIYAENENIIRGLRFDNYKIKFPLYANIIQNNFMKGQRRKELLEHSCEYFNFLFNNFPDLPYICTEKIFSYLSDINLKILLSDFRKGEGRKELLEQCFQFFYLKCFAYLPYDCTDHIFSYLNDEDLRILIVACKPTNISNPNIY